MTQLLLAFALTTPSQPATTFTAIGAADETPTGTLAAVSLSDGALLKTPNGNRTVKRLVSLQRPDTARPGIPTGAQLVTAGGDAIRPHAKSDDRIDFHVPANGRVILTWE